MANSRAFLIVSGLLEAGTGLSLLFLPDMVLVLLLGLEHAAPETLLVGRVAGAALLAIGIACWPARNDGRNLSQQALFVGLLTYNLAAVVLLSWAAMVLQFVGVFLWPAVGLHTALAAWSSIVCVSSRNSDR